jgi:hypothetical protein
MDEANAEEDAPFAATHECANGTKQTSRRYQSMSAFGGKADIAAISPNVDNDPNRTSKWDGVETRPRFPARAAVTAGAFRVHTNSSMITFAQYWAGNALKRDGRHGAPLASSGKAP